jgi:putative hydrolase of the HAD superfamily
MKALVLDFGGPVLRTPFELLRGGERRSGLAAGTLDWTGPFDPRLDDAWRAMQAGDMTERDYWMRRSEQFAELTGRDSSFRGLMDVLFDADEAELVRPEALAAIAAAHERGLAVAVLTNDMRAFHGDEWVARMRVLDMIDVVVDGSVEHVLKPDPRIYRLALDRLAVPARDCLFVDDQPGNIEGARHVGMQTVWFDVTDPSGSYDSVLQMLPVGRS